MRAWLRRSASASGCASTSRCSRHTSFRIGGPGRRVGRGRRRRRDPSRAARWPRGGRCRSSCSAAAPMSWSATAACAASCIKLGPRLRRRSIGAPTAHGSHVRAGAAAPFKKLVTEAAQRAAAPGSSSPRAFPASIGGGLLMNAGAFGGEIATWSTGIAGVDAGRRASAICRAPSCASAIATSTCRRASSSPTSTSALQPGDAASDRRAHARDAKRKRDGASAARLAECRLDLQEPARRVSPAG